MRSSLSAMFEDAAGDEWRCLIWLGERAMLDGRPEQAERIYTAALSAAKDQSPDESFWLKTQMNLRYLYFTPLRCEPHTPDALLARTLPLWTPILGPDHHFIAWWIELIEAWRRGAANT